MKSIESTIDINSQDFSENYKNNKKLNHHLRQTINEIENMPDASNMNANQWLGTIKNKPGVSGTELCLLYTSDAADE